MHTQGRKWGMLQWAWQKQDGMLRPPIVRPGKLIDLLWRNVDTLQIAHDQAMVRIEEAGMDWS
jgi:hypothetical protein